MQHFEVLPCLQAWQDPSSCVAVRQNSRGSEPIDVLEVVSSGPAHKHAERVFRDLARPIGALNAARLEQVLARFKSFADTDVPPFHYGMHSQQRCTPALILDPCACCRFALL